MKLKHLFFNALAVMTFAACSSEAEEIKPADKSTTATLQLDMTGQYGGGSSDQTRALSLDGTEYPRFIHEEGVTDWSTHCFIRNEAGDVQFYALVDWNATTDSDGNISLHIKNSTLTLQNSAGSDVTATETLPKAGERWYIAGIAGGGVLDETKSNVNFAYNETLDTDLKPNQARIPLAFGWTRFTIPSNTERAPQIVVQFKPQGTLLSVYVNNRTNQGQSTINSLLKITTNALSQNGVFDYSTATTREEYPTNPKWVYTNSEATPEVIGRKVILPKDTGANCYVWAMPRTTAPTEGFSTSVGLAGYQIFADGTSNKPAALATAFQPNLAYPISPIDVIRAYVPLEYVAEYDVMDENSFATDHTNRNAGYFNWSDTYTKFLNKTIDGKKYHLPTFNEWKAALCTPKFDGESSLFFKTAREFNNMPENTTIDGYTLNTFADFVSTGNNICYALRYKSDDNQFLCAYRYEMQGDFVNGSLNSQLVVKARHLGASFTGDVATITNEDFWTDSQVTYVTRTFPFHGFRRNTDLNYVRSGVRIHAWGLQDTNKLASQASSLSSDGSTMSIGLMSTENYLQYLTIRLFKDEL